MEDHRQVFLDGIRDLQEPPLGAFVLDGGSLDQTVEVLPNRTTDPESRSSR